MVKVGRKNHHSIFVVAEYNGCFVVLVGNMLFIHIFFEKVFASDDTRILASNVRNWDI